MVTTKHCCCYGHREHMNRVIFMPFPKPHMDREKSERWIEERADGKVLGSTTLRNTQTFARCI